MNAKEPCRRVGEGIELTCHVQPGARSSGFAGRHGDAIKLRIAAVAVDGKANLSCQEFLAEAFGVAKSEVVLLQGAVSRHKRWWIKRIGRWPPELQGLL